MGAVLGISAYYHDAAAALVIDGTIVAAMQEERFSRRKNDPALPTTAALACLEASGLRAGDLDRVVFYEEPQAKLERIVVSLLRAFPRSCRQFPRALGSQVGSKLWVLPQLVDALDVPREKIVTATHHLSHAASAFFASPFQRAAVITVDGVGEDITTGVWLGEGNDITPVSSIEYPHSLGLFYAALTAYLGFEVNEGEYKVMGLAAFGRLASARNSTSGSRSIATAASSSPCRTSPSTLTPRSASGPSWKRCSVHDVRRIGRGI